jgi:tetratricopeptide (TPR) repeat protein
MPAPAPPASPAPARTRWILAGAAAGVVGLIVMVALLSGKEPADSGPAEHAEPGEANEPGEATGPGEPGEHAIETGEETGTAEDDPARAAYARELAVAAAYLEQGQPRHARDLLDRLRRHDPDNAEIHYLLGKALLYEGWVKDGLDAFRDAIALDPGYRSHADLIEHAAAGLGSDSEHFAVSRFLIRDIGAAARPALENIAAHHDHEEVRERANRALSQLP